MAEHYDDSMKWLVDEIVKDDDDLVLAGIYADKRGYHNKRNNLPNDDYSVKLPPDKEGPSNKASAFDITSKKAQRGDYSNIKKYSNRLLNAGKSNDPRMDGWREFFGQTDNDSEVEGWDFYHNKSATSSDKTHNWHVHGSELRKYNTSKVNKEAFLSVWRGESLADYKARGGKLVNDQPQSKPPTPSKPAPLAVDGVLGPKTISRWQQIMGTTVDGKIDAKNSQLIKAVQRRLKGTVDHRLVEDGILGPNTIGALQRYLKTPVDRFISKPKSLMVMALQRRLNEGRF